MIKLMDKHAIIKLKLQNFSNRKVAKILNIDRKTVAKYWDSHLALTSKLNDDSIDVKEVQEKIIEVPKYDSSKRMPRKYNDDIDKLLDDILENEDEKIKSLGWNKQRLTGDQIYELIKAEGHDIGVSTIRNKIREKRDKAKECFIKQKYNYGDRLEYDFGEVRLEINGEVGTYHLAVLSSPASDFRWAYLYKNQKQDVFLDSHVKFFDMVGGVYKEVVYDNMKNVVTRFIGRNEKELNNELIKLSIYYGYDINVTNCYRGNEKGYVESSVKYIRNKVFSKVWKFVTFEDAQSYLQGHLDTLNKESNIIEEKKVLLPYKPKLELANLVSSKVNKYSFIVIDTNFYSVPDYLVGRKVISKVYYDSIEIYSNDKLVCKHKKVDGEKEYSIDIMHYLNTFKKKPGAIKNSHALKCSEQLNSIYNKYYKSNPKNFIEFLHNNKEKSLIELVQLCQTMTESQFTSYNLKDNETTSNKLTEVIRTQANMYNDIYLGGRVA